MFDLTDRQKLILKIIVEEYISTAEPISSSLIIEKFLKNLSSATVRNEMLFLEKSMLLEKTHTSSGRIPSTVGYKYYHENILSPKINNDIKTKLLKILNNRELGIDSVIDQSVQIIQENLHLPVITQTFDNIELLKRFDLIRITEYEALVIFVTSSGNITKSTIVITNNSEYEDVAICVRVFNDRLVDTPIKEIKYKLDVIKEIIKSQVHEYENVVRTFIEKIFSNNTVSIKSNVVGTKFLTSQPEFQNIDKLNKVLEFLEDTNV
jgi:heat-inducible transcriptional repressor